MDHPSQYRRRARSPDADEHRPRVLQPPRGHDRLDLSFGACVRHPPPPPLRLPSITCSSIQAREAIAVAAEFVPEAVEVVVPFGDTEAVGRQGAAGGDRDGVDHPAGDDDASGAGIQPVDDSLHGDQGAVGGQDGLLLYAGDAPQLDVAVAVGLLGVHDRHIRVRSAGTAASSSPVNGHVIALTLARLARSVPVYPRITANGRRAAPAEYRLAMPAWLCSSSSIGRGQPCSTASRNRCSPPTPGIASVGEHKPPRRAHPDHLVVEHVGRHADQLELSTPLAQELDGPRRTGSGA